MLGPPAATWGDLVVGVSIETGIARTVGIEPDDASGLRGNAGRLRGIGGEHPAVRLHGQRGDRTKQSRLEGRVERAVGVQSRETGVGRHAAGEGSPDQDLAVGLHRHGLDAVGGVGIEVGVERTVGIEPRQTVAVSRTGGTVGSQLGEIAADQNPAVGLQRDGVDHVVGARVEAVVEGAIGVEARHKGVRKLGRSVAGRDRREGAADYNLPVGLDRHGQDSAVGVGIGKRRVDRTVGVEADKEAVVDGGIDIGISDQPSHVITRTRVGATEDIGVGEALVDRECTTAVTR